MAQIFPIVSAASSNARELLSSPRTYYVDPAGNDANDGLTPGTAFLNPQFALDLIGTLDSGVEDITLQFANGTYNFQNIVIKQPLGTGNLILTGDTVTPSNVVLSSTVVGDMFGAAGTRVFIDAKGFRGTISGMRIEATTAQAVDLLQFEGNPARCFVEDVEFNGTDTGAGTTRVIVSVFGGIVFLQNNILLDGDYGRFASVFNGGVLQTVNGLNFTLGGTCDCQTSFVRADNGGFLQFSPTATLTGTNTSGVTRADVSNNAVCKLFTIAAALGTAGFLVEVVTNGGQYQES